MKEVGYGVLKEGKPCGIWPMNHEQCSITLRRYVSKDKEHGDGPYRYDIVTVFVGNPVGLYTKPPAENLPPEDKLKLA